jgi:hypothetical protein
VAKQLRRSSSETKVTNEKERGEAAPTKFISIVVRYGPQGGNFGPTMMTVLEKHMVSHVANKTPPITYIACQNRYNSKFTLADNPTA